MTISSSDYTVALQSPYMVTVTGSLNGYPLITDNYKFNVTVVCDVGELYPQNDNINDLLSTPEYTYTIRDEALIIRVKKFAA